MRQVTISVDDGKINIDNQDFEDFELRGLLLAVADSLQVQQNVYHTAHLFQTGSHLRNVLKDIVSEVSDELLNEEYEKESNSDEQMEGKSNG